MPLFMDIHSFCHGVAADDMAKAHLADLRTQGRHETRYLRYWVDEQRGKAFCLVEAPSVAAAETVHYEAHGLVADEIYRVQEGNGPGNAGPAKRCGGKEMSYPHIHAALARERQDTLLAEAQAVHQAREARAYRRRHASTAVRGARFRRAPGWLPSAWSRLLTSRPDSA